MLQKHVSAAQGNAMYMSPHLQNQLISCVGDWIPVSVLTEVREAGYFSVLADERVDASVYEQMPLILRFMDSTSDVHEEFIGFILCDDGASGRALADNILSTLHEFNVKFNVRMMRGQRYDGAGNMAGKINGTAALIQ